LIGAVGAKALVYGKAQRSLALHVAVKAMKSLSLIYAYTYAVV